MDPIINPYAPGAGTPPPELSGRAPLVEAARVALARRQSGRSSKGMILVGLRGVGKTVLLDRIETDAIDSGIVAVSIEASEQLSLAAAVVQPLRSALITLSRRRAARAIATRALRALAGFVATVRLRYQDVELSLDIEPEPGVADSGDLTGDLIDLFELVGRAAQAGGTCVVLMIDELQYVREDEMAALLRALHRAAQRRLPIMMIGAGLPQLRGQLGQAKTYAERQFEISDLGALPPADARDAIAKPAAAEGVEFQPEALEAIVSQTQGYPYFLQEWGKHVWDVAERSPITASDVAVGAGRAVAALDSSFFTVRVDRMTPAERRYVRAMAELGAGPHRSRDVASALGLRTSSVGSVRSRLIDKGMVWSPETGLTAFTVPLFDEFMKRSMPELE